MAIQLSRADRLQRVLEDLKEKSSDIRGALLVTENGLVVAAVMDDAEQFGAIAANLFDLSRKASQRLDQGDVERVVVDAEQGTIVVFPAGPHVSLTAIVDKDAKLGLILQLVARAVPNIAEMMD
ncbi:MAG: roadblock/LC7 domain-containing protein [Thermoflexales bacterium]|nr:roadblock/LC7 domain-containing protein [Thermoflexales bacterium]